MRLSHLLAVVALCVMTLSFASSCPASDEAAVRIGVYLPLSGANAFGGQLELKGVELACRERPTVLGRKVELVVEDNRSDRQAAEAAVERLVAGKGVSAVIGTYGSDLAIAGGKVCERARTPMVGTSCSNPLVTMGKIQCFRVCNVDVRQAAAAATYLYKVLGVRRVAILEEETSAYSEGLAAMFRHSFLKLGGTVVAFEKFASGTSSWAHQLATIEEASPEVLFMPVYFEDGVRILREAWERGLSCRMMGADAMDNPDAEARCGSLLRDFLLTTHPYDAAMPGMGEEARRFTEAWKAAYPGIKPNAIAALGYTAYLAVHESITRAGTSDRSSVRKALCSLKDLATPLGLLTINRRHDAETPVGIIEYKSGRRSYVAEIRP